MRGVYRGIMIGDYCGDYDYWEATYARCVLQVAASQRAQLGVPSRSTRARVSRRESMKAEPKKEPGFRGRPAGQGQGHTANIK
jgi:hypothetical protein